MGDGGQLLEDLRPKVGRNFMAPYILPVPQGTVYTKVTFRRPSLLIPLSPTTVGSILLYPGGTPPNDNFAIPYPNGVAVVEGEGEWYIRTTSAVDELLKVIDGTNASANVPALASTAVNLVSIGGVAQTGLNLTARYAPVVWAASDLETVDGSSELIVAANAARRALNVYNASTGGQVITLSISNPAVALTGFIVLAPGAGYIWNPLDAVTQQAIYAIASAAGGALMWSEGT